MLVLLIFVGSVLHTQGFVLNGGEEITLSNYHNYDQLKGVLEELSKAEVVRRYTIGQSELGRDIEALVLSDSPGGERELLKLMVKLVANMHGDEAVGREMLVALAQHLAVNYATDKRVQNLLKSVEIHLVPTMNPDGFEAVKRENNNGKDLNRDFPNWKDIGKSVDELKSGRQRETSSMMSWILDNPFILSANFHDGAVVANYPWDNIYMRPSEKSELFLSDGENNRTPDNKVFEDLALVYSSNHKTMYKSTQFVRGITNGVEWYPIGGGMQDFNYLFTNCMEITVEMSTVKKPDAKQLQGEWENNFESLMAYLEYGTRSVHGLVTDGNNNPVDDAHVIVEGEGKIVTTTNRGEYWRFLVPGEYRIKATGDGFESEWSKVIVTEEGVNRVDLTLSKEVEETKVTTETPSKPQQGIQVTLVPGWCVELNFFQFPIWC